MNKEKVEIKREVMLIDTNKQYFDMQEIENRRFMYNPQSGNLILGFQFSGGGLKYSHAEEHAKSKVKDAFDSMVRGWVGSGKDFKDGVIHFSPNIDSRYSILFNRAFDTLEMFSRNNANDNTVVRGFGKTWEQPLSKILKERQVDIMADKANTRYAAAPETEPPSVSSVTPIVLEGKTQKDKLEEITDKLKQGVKDIFSSDKYKEYLSVMSKFHHYSPRNVLLILMQKPDASMIAGYGSWQRNFKRQVNRGEKGIKIISPSPYTTQKEVPLTDRQTGQPIFRPDGTPMTQLIDVTIPSYKVTNVFDVSQTSGEPLPSLGVDELHGNIDNYKNFMAALEKVSPVPIGFEKIEGSANGYFNPTEQRIAVREGMSELQTVKTLIHEIAHAKLHNTTPDEFSKLPPEEQKDRHTKEVEAESTAYTVCQHYGIDTSDYSFGYVAGWSSDKDAPELNASLKTIQKTAHEIIGSIDERLAELEQEQQAQEQTAEPNADLNIKIGEWYKQEFPTDELGAEINGDITFQQLYDGLADKDTYDMLGVNDSVVRERCFEKLADMKQVDYSEIYDKWSQNFEQPPKQEQPTAEPKQEPQKTADEFQELSDADAEKAAKIFEQKDDFAEAPTVADLEQKVKAGESISLLDLANASKTDNPKAAKAPKKSAPKKQAEKKPSIRQQLKDEKEKAAKQPKKSAPEKKKEDLSI